MTTSEFVTATFHKATGKLPTFQSGTTKWNNIVASGNFYIRQWAGEKDVDWFSLYDPAFSVGKVTATDTFDLDKTIRKISVQDGDSIRVTHLNGNYTDYVLTSPSLLKTHKYGNYVAKIGKTLRFNRSFATTDQQFGGTITVPAFLHPKQIARDKDVVPVDDPNWLVLVCAADYVRNDITRKDLRADLIDEANGVMSRMVQDNEEAQDSELQGDWSPDGHIYA